MSLSWLPEPEKRQNNSLDLSEVREKCEGRQVKCQNGAVTNNAVGNLRDLTILYMIKDGIWNQALFYESPQLPTYHLKYWTSPASYRPCCPWPAHVWCSSSTQSWSWSSFPSQTCRPRSHFPLHSLSLCRHRRCCLPTSLDFELCDWLGASWSDLQLIFMCHYVNNLRETYLTMHVCMYDCSELFHVRNIVLKYWGLQLELNIQQISLCLTFIHLSIVYLWTVDNVTTAAQTFALRITFLGCLPSQVRRLESLHLHLRHIHAAALAVWTVSLALVALLEVLHTLYVIQVGEVLVAHLQTLFVGKVISQDFTWESEWNRRNENSIFAILLLCWNKLSIMWACFLFLTSIDANKGALGHIVHAADAPAFVQGLEELQTYLQAMLHQAVGAHLRATFAPLVALIDPKREIERGREGQIRPFSCYTN